MVLSSETTSTGKLWHWTCIDFDFLWPDAIQSLVRGQIEPAVRNGKRAEDFSTVLEPRLIQNFDTAFRGLER